MKLIENNRLVLSKWDELTRKPAIFDRTTEAFWDDEHISAQMLKLHLNPDAEAASKKLHTIDAEADFIVRQSAMGTAKTVIDLGCGPGLYVQRFAQTGAKVLGVDISARSIRYATETVGAQCQNVRFAQVNYLDMKLDETFDVATLIFYDFCALIPEEQKMLLKNIHSILKLEGQLFFDVITEFREPSEDTRISVCQSGFWSPNAYLEIEQHFLYDAPKIECVQYTIINELGDARVFRLFHRMFRQDEICEMLSDSGFVVEKILKNLTGEPLPDRSATFGIVERKRESAII